jgi:hypothetical protein
MEDAAAASGRSVASEIEHRLERSFVIDALLSPELQRVALLAAATFRDPERPLQAPEQWRNDPDRYDSAWLRVARALWREHPDESPERLERLERLIKRLWQTEKALEAARAEPDQPAAPEQQ